MPASSTCFRYPADVPAGIGNRDAVRPAPPGLRSMPVTSSCFRYPDDVPPGPRTMTYTTCFRYPAEVPPGPRRMPTGSACFRY